MAILLRTKKQEELMAIPHEKQEACGVLRPRARWPWRGLVLARARGCTCSTELSCSREILRRLAAKERPCWRIAEWLRVMVAGVSGPATSRSSSLSLSSSSLPDFSMWFDCGSGSPRPLAVEFESPFDGCIARLRLAASVANADLSLDPVKAIEWRRLGGGPTGLDLAVATGGATLVTSAALVP